MLEIDLILCLYRHKNNTPGMTIFRRNHEFTKRSVLLTAVQCMLFVFRNKVFKLI